jgi:hypothetical protein
MSIVLTVTTSSHKSPSVSRRWQSLGLCVGLLALLSACAESPPVVVDQSQEAVQYQARAARHYAPPGPPSDPWGPYILEAAGRFDVPEAWVRAVMRVESGGRLYEYGRLITSPVGAMGLMQVMPETYDGLRQRYSLNDDAYDPYNNILAGTAYIREMYDLYGSPAFLAAYNAGPARLEDYLNNRRGLPDETRHYVAKAGPNVIGIYPERRSPVDELAYNQLPLSIPVGLRYPPAPRAETRVAQAVKRSAPAAAARNGHGARPVEKPVEVAQLPEPPAAPARGATDLRITASPVAKVRLVAQTVPLRHDAVPQAGWAKGPLVQAHPAVGTVKEAHVTGYHARLTGGSKDGATQACGKLSKSHGNCMVLSPGAQL